MLSLDGRSFEIIGVTPPEFFGPEVGRSFDVAIPLCAEPMIRGEGSALGKPDFWFLDIMARLAPGWTAERADAQLKGISPGIFKETLPARYNAETAKHYLAFKLTAKPAGTGVSGLRNAYATQLWILLGATALVLLITCANLANLMLARATTREREIAVRLAIGASRKRLVRQMLSESLLIAGLGALGGIVLAQWLSKTLVMFLSTENNRLFVDLSPDWRVFAFITGVAILACLFFGLSPALKATGTSPGKAMQAGGSSQSDSAERFAARRGLVVVQVALSMVLIVGAMLFGRSLRNLVTVDPGFRQEGILVIDVDIRRSGISEGARAQVYAQVMDRVRSVAGVEGAAEAEIVPMSGSGWNQTLIIDGIKKDGIVNMNRVGVDYFKTMEHAAGRRPDVRPRRSPGRYGNHDRQRIAGAQVLWQRQSYWPNVPDRHVARRSLPALPDRRRRPRHEVSGTARGVHADRLLRRGAGDASRPRARHGSAIEHAARKPDTDAHACDPRGGAELHSRL